MTRTTNPDATALGASLRCSLTPLRKAAREVLAAALKANDGNLYAVSDQLGIDRKAVQRKVAGEGLLTRTRIGAARGR